jgi:hypothetical protein
VGKQNARPLRVILFAPSGARWGDALKPVSTFTVRPFLPEALRPLAQIASNLRWSWDHAAIELFRRLDRDGWERCNRNPVLLLGTIHQSVLDAAAEDSLFSRISAESPKSWISICPGKAAGTSASRTVNKPSPSPISLRSLESRSASPFSPAVSESLPAIT